MPPKAEKKPTTAGKAPAGKAPTEKKEAGKKTAAASGDKKKRSKTRKETYSSYIYKGMPLIPLSFCVRGVGKMGTDGGSLCLCAPRGYFHDGGILMTCIHKVIEHAP